MPLVYLQNTTGFMVGKQYEQNGIIKHGAKMINAVSNSTVPQITIMTGSSYGAGNYAMVGRSYSPRFLFTWPNHKIAVMGGKQIAGVMSIVRRGQAARKGLPFDEETDARPGKGLDRSQRSRDLVLAHGAEDQVEVPEGIEVAEEGSPLLDGFVVAFKEHLGAAEGIGQPLIQKI